MITVVATIITQLIPKTFFGVVHYTIWSKSTKCTICHSGMAYFQLGRPPKTANQGISGVSLGCPWVPLGSLVVLGWFLGVPGGSLGVPGGPWGSLLLLALLTKLAHRVVGKKRA